MNHKKYTWKIDLLRLYNQSLENIRCRSLSLKEKQNSLLNFNSHRKTNYWKVIHDACFKEDDDLPFIMKNYYILKAKAKFTELQKSSIKQNIEFTTLYKNHLSNIRKLIVKEQELQKKSLKRRSFKQSDISSYKQSLLIVNTKNKKKSTNRNNLENLKLRKKTSIIDYAESEEVKPEPEIIQKKNIFIAKSNSKNINKKLSIINGEHINAFIYDPLNYKEKGMNNGSKSIFKDSNNENGLLGKQDNTRFSKSEKKNLVYNKISHYIKNNKLDDLMKENTYGINHRLLNENFRKSYPRAFMTSQKQNFRKKINQKSSTNNTLLTEVETFKNNNIIRNHSEGLIKTDINISLIQINKRYGLNYDKLPRLIKGTTQFFKRSDFYYNY